MSAGYGEQEVYGAEETKNDAAVQTPVEEPDVIEGLGWNRYGVIVDPTPERQPWRLSLMDSHNREIFAITPATDEIRTAVDPDDSDLAISLNSEDSLLATVEAEDVMR